MSQLKNDIKEEQVKLEQRIKALEAENADLKQRLSWFQDEKETVSCPESFQPIFEEAQKTVKEYFKNIDFNPSQGTISINDDRYILIRASALSSDFFKAIKQLYRDQNEDVAFNIGENFLFDIGHLIGMEDAKQLHMKMALKDPIEKLAAGPVHFAYSGWAFVDIHPESNPTPDENFFLKYDHPYSFEAESWIKKGEKSDKPVCIMNAAYSSGWCGESYGIQLTAVETHCRAKGDERCTFIMAPPDRINEYLHKDIREKSRETRIPVFFERKTIEQGLVKSLEEKDILLKEIHHRVKNNLQIISSFLNLQFSEIEDPKILDAIKKSKSRINSMALIHTKLYQSDKLASINFGEYIKELLESLIENYAMDKDIAFKIKHPKAFFDIDLSVNLGLIITELVTNSCKHAFKQQEKGLIQVELKKLSESEHELVISDNGSGISDDINLDHPKGLGTEIVLGLVDQIDGTLQISDDEGLSYAIQFKSE
jgi:two-component sensor histidine kinase/predicted hydrocarbon binding protein